MANTKITSLTELAETPASGDMFPIVDVSDTSMAATGTTKKLAGSRIVFQSGGTATLASTLVAPVIRPSASSNGSINFYDATTILPALGIIAGTASGLALRGTDIITDATTKQFRVASRHYTNSEEDCLLFYCSNTTSANVINIGGNSSLFNTATAIVFFAAANNTTVTGTEMMRVNSGGVGVGTTAPFGFQVGLVAAGLETARSSDNVRMGILSSGAPAIVFEDSGNTQGVIKNLAGIFSLGKPGTPQMSIDTATGIATFVAAIDVGGTVQMDGLRVDITPTLSSQAQTHYINVNMNGTTYKLLLAS